MAGNNLGTATGSIQINTSGLKNADIALRSAGTSMINLGTQAVAAFAMIVSEAAKFEKEMDFVQAVTTASADEMSALEDAAINLAKNSIYGPIDLAAAFVELAKAGASAQDIIGGVGEAAVNLATAADIEIPFAGENLINLLNTFKLEAGDATRVADLMAGAANASALEFDDLVTTMRYAGPVAQALNIPIEDLTDAITILGKVGIKGSTAGTSLRFMMTRLVPDTDKAKTALRELGFTIGDDGLVKEFSNADGSMRPLAEIIGELTEKTKGLNDQAKVAAVNDIFGVRAMPAVLELLAAGEQGFADINAEINRTTAADVAAKRMDNLDGSIKRLKATLSAMFVEAGGPFQEMLKGWVDGLREFLLFIDALPGPLKTFLVGAVGVIGVMSIFAGVFLLTIGNIVRMVRVIAEIRNAFALFSTAARGAAAANTAMGASFLLNPITLIILAIIALVAILVILYKKWEPFRNLVDDTWAQMKVGWERIKELIGQIPEFFQKIVDKVVGIWNDFKDAWDTLWSGIGTGGGGVLEDIALKIHAAWDSVVNFFKGIGSTISDAVTGSIDAVLGFFGSIGSAIEGAVTAAAEFVLNFPNMIKNGLSAAGDALKNFATDALEAIVNFFKELPRRAGYAIGFMIGRFIKFHIDAVKEFIGFAKDAIKTLKNFAIDAVLWAFNFGRDMITTFLNMGVQIVKTVVDWCRKVYEAVVQFAIDTAVAFVNFLQSLPGMFIEWFTAVLNFLINFIPEMTGRAWEMGSSFVTTLIDFFSALPGQIWGFLQDALNWVIQFGLDLVAEGLKMGQDFFNAVIDFISDMPGKVWDILNEVIDTFKNLVQTAFNAAKDFAGGLWDGFKEGLGISSPSFIEEALFAIRDQSKATLGSLNSDVHKMGLLGNRMIPDVTAGSFNPTPAAAVGGASSQWNQNGPLVGQATIRDERDIYELARELADEQDRRMRGRGVTTSGW